jgi:8-oxo-dGTP pyrophosphatase MutT (NUDIX family)
LPGGGVKKNEKSIDAAIREVYEETGIKLKLTVANLVTKKLTLKENGIKTIIDCYSINLPKIVSTHSENLEIMESIWVPWSKIIDTTSISGNSNQLLHIWLDKTSLVD